MKQISIPYISLLTLTRLLYEDPVTRYFLVSFAINKCNFRLYVRDGLVPLDTKTKVTSLIQTPYLHNLLSFAKGEHFFLRGQQYFKFDFVEVRNRQSIFRIDQIYYKPIAMAMDTKEVRKENAEQNRPVPVFMGLRFSVDRKKRVLVGTGTSVECQVSDIVKKVEVTWDESKAHVGAFKVFMEQQYRNGPIRKYQHPTVHNSIIT